MITRTGRQWSVASREGPLRGGGAPSLPVASPSGLAKDSAKGGCGGSSCRAEHHPHPVVAGRSFGASNFISTSILSAAGLVGRGWGVCCVGDRRPALTRISPEMARYTFSRGSSAHAIHPASPLCRLASFGLTAPSRCAAGAS